MTAAHAKTCACPPCFAAHVAEWNARRLCRRCGGTGTVTVMETIDPDGTQSPLYDAPCPRCAGVGTEPMSVAEIISSGLRVKRGAR